MLTSFRHGALTIVEELKPSSEVVRDLKKLDDRLFLEKQLTFKGEEVWCVVCELGSDRPPITILEWRDTSGRPIAELSSGLVGRVARMDRDAGRLNATVARQNAAKIEADRRRSHDTYAEIANDMIPRMAGTRSAVLHRGQYLRRSRDAQRNRGENV